MLEIYEIREILHCDSGHNANIRPSDEPRDHNEYVWVKVWVPQRAWEWQICWSSIRSPIPQEENHGNKHPVNDPSVPWFLGGVDIKGMGWD